MSDDTPTQRFDAAGDAPTERFDASSPAASAEVVDERKSRKLMTILAIVGGALLIAVLIVLILLLTRSNAAPGALPTQSSSPSASASPTPSATPTKSATPTPTPTPTQTPTPTATAAPPPPPQTGPAFSQFNVKSSQGGCSMGGPGFDPTYPVVQVQWKAVRSDEAWIVTGTSDAVDSGFMQIPLNGDQNDFQYPITLQCNQDATTFTITLLGSNGEHLSKSWTVQNTGDKF
jgi:hypothetical protein